MLIIGYRQECYGLKHDFAASDRRNTLIIRMTRISILLKSVPFDTDRIYQVDRPGS